jgi:O-antigen/teichoic acid export membrane protein
MAVNSLAVAIAVSAAEAVAAHRLCPGLLIVPFRTRAPEAREILWFGARLQATRAAEVLGDHLPRLVLSFGPGLAAAGIYDLGARLAGLLRVAGRLPLPVIQPLASRLLALREPERLAGVLRHATRFTGILVLPAAVLLLLDAPALLTAWTGAAAGPGAAAGARLLAAGLAISLLLSPARLMLRGLGFPGIEAAASAGGVALQLALALLLAAPFGAAGVAAAAPAAALVAGFILLAGARRLRAPLPAAVLPHALRGPVAAAAAMGVAGLLLHLRPAGTPVDRAGALAHLLPETAILGLVALGVAAWCGGLRRQDLEALRDLAGAERGRA